jgi:hypothetical protein
MSSSLIATTLRAQTLNVFPVPTANGIEFRNLNATGAKPASKISVPTSVPSVESEIDEMLKYMGIAGDASRNNATCGQVYCSVTPKGKFATRMIETTTQTAIQAKETQTKLAHLGLCVALLGVISVIV